MVLLSGGSGWLLPCLLVCLFLGGGSRFGSEGCDCFVCALIFLLWELALLFAFIYLFLRALILLRQSDCSCNLLVPCFTQG